MAGDPKGLRLFLAIELADLFREPIAGFIDRSSRQIKSVRWVRPEQVHLTLHFFGSTPEDQIPLIKEAAGAQTRSFSSFEIRLENFGSFPPHGQPRVLWIGVEGEVAAMKALQGNIAGALSQKGFAVEERSFSPHATVARVKDKLPLPDLQKIKGLSFPATELKCVDRLLLIESLLKPDGPIYEIIETFPLSKNKTV